MKKTLSILLSAIMILSMLTVFATAATPNYDTAKDGDVLYNVDFRGTDGIYEPFVFRVGAAKMEATTIEISEDGKTIVATAPASAASAYFYGGAIKGLTLGEGKKYTIEFTAAFPSGNAGVYFNFSDRYKGDGIPDTSDQTYNSLYGIYGRLTGTNFTMSRAAGAKLNGDNVSLSSGYTKSPVDIPNNTDATLRFEIDGFFYSVYVNDTFYDSVYMLNKVDCSFEPVQNLGFSIYLYNNNAKFTVKNVTVKKGCSYTAAEHRVVKEDPAYPAIEKLDYSAAKYGDKLTDLLFNAKTGAFQPAEISKNTTNTMEISEDGKSYKSTIGGTAGAEWYGGPIGGLKVKDGNFYTFRYKIKCAGTSYTGAIAYNCYAPKPGDVYRLNWYGTFSNTELTFMLNGATEPNAANGVKYAANGTNFSTTNYGSEPMKEFEGAAYVDADGFSEVAVELDGWTWTYYARQADGSFKKLSTIDNRELLKQLGVDADNYRGDDLGFQMYTYNKNVTMTVKDVELYKGLTVSDPTGAQHGTQSPENPPVNPPQTGDALIWVAAIAMVSILGMGLVIKARKN